MAIKRLKENKFKEITEALIRFYNLRPDSYGLYERNQNAYNDYAYFIEKYVTSKQDTILDVGTGAWRCVDTIAKKGYKQVIGLDYFSDEKLKEYTNEIQSKNAKLVSYKEPEKIPFDNKAFNCVTSLCVVEHLINIENVFNEMDRVLADRGYLIINCPNWSGINVPISAFVQVLKNKKRYWHYENLLDCIKGVFQSLYWYIEAKFSKPGTFILIYPRMRNNEIDFEFSDDDAVHMCQPISIRKYFESKGYQTIYYNRNSGTTPYSKFFNKLFPSMATTNQLVFQKS